MESEKQIINVFQLSHENCAEVKEYHKAVHYTTPPMRAITGVKFPDNSICLYGEWAVQYSDETFRIIKNDEFQKLFAHQSAAYLSSDGRKTESPVSVPLWENKLSEQINGWSFDYDWLQKLADMANEKDPQVSPSMEDVEAVLLVLHDLYNSLPLSSSHVGSKVDLVALQEKFDEALTQESVDTYIKEHPEKFANLSSSPTSVEEMLLYEDVVITINEMQWVGRRIDARELLEKLLVLKNSLTPKPKTNERENNRQD